MFDTTHYTKCIKNAEKAFELLQQTDADDQYHGIARSACVKEFELILEQSGTLLRKCLRSKFHNPKAAASLSFKNIFRQAAKFGLINLEQAERWLNYRDSRDDTAYDHGEQYMNETVNLLPDFLPDAKALQQVIANCVDD